MDKKAPAPRKEEEKIKDDEIYKPVKGEDDVDLFPNIYLCARKAMGKTWIIWQILKAMPKKIPVIIFCPSADTDSLWERIVKWLKKRGHPVFIYYSFIDPETGENDFTAVVDHMTKQNRADPGHKKIKKPKYVLIMDDLGKAMRKPYVYQFLLRNRHEKCVCILSGQSMKNITPELRQQVNEWCLFPKLNEKDLEMIYTDSPPPIDLEEFKKEYHAATGKQYSFLYYTPKGLFRTKFGPARQLGGWGITEDEEKRMREEAKQRTERLEKEAATRNSESWFVRMLRELGFDRAADKYHAMYGKGPVPSLDDALKLLQLVKTRKATK